MGNKNINPLNRSTSEHKIVLSIEKNQPVLFFLRSFIPHTAAIIYEERKADPGNFNNMLRSGHANVNTVNTIVNIIPKVIKALEGV